MAADCRAARGPLPSCGPVLIFDSVMSANLETAATRPDLWTAIKRGLALRCPVCGEGKLFRSYLKLNDRCSHCDAKLSELRADDGPAWATILIVGHLIVPFFIVTVRSNAPD